LGVAGQQPMRFERDGQPVRRRAGQGGRLDEVGQRARLLSHRCQDRDGLVDNADSAGRLSHTAILESQILGWQAMSGKTLAEKLWDSHVVHSAPGEPDLVYIDMHLVHEVTSPQAFDGLRLAGRPVHRPDLTLATEDHNTPTDYTLPLIGTSSIKDD